jgi:acid phosphatase type 7
LPTTGGYTAVLPPGDLQYDCGRLSAFNAVYHPTWGRVKSISRP